MKIRTKVRAGGINLNHNTNGVKVRTKIRAGGIQLNHNTTAVR